MNDDIRFLLMFASGFSAFILVAALLAYTLTEVGFWYFVGALFVLTLIPLAILGVDHYVRLMVKVKVREHEEELERIRKRYE